MDEREYDFASRRFTKPNFSSPCEKNNDDSDNSHHGSWGDVSSQPPSYDSIFGQFQDTTDGGGNSLEYFKTAVIMFLGTAGCTISLMLLLAIPMSMILIGAKYKDDCPVEPFIPIYLIVGGSFGIVKTIIVIIQGILYSGDIFSRNNDKQIQVDERPSVWIFVDGFLNLFLFTWFIAGNIWVYSNYKPHFTPPLHQPMNYCNKTLYLFSFWVITTSYIVIGLLCLCTCCLGMCASCTAYFVAANQNTNNT